MQPFYIFLAVAFATAYGWTFLEAWFGSMVRAQKIFTVTSWCFMVVFALLLIRVIAAHA